MAGPKLRTLWFTYFIFFTTLGIVAQNVDLETFTKGRALKLGGGVSANGIFHSSDQTTGRLPFTYYLQGNLNVGLYQFSMPLSYSYSNQGSQLDYDLPINLNRLSLHPKYKWILGHIGDVAMTFSPYTLNGHQFTGGGLELTPKGPFKISAMVGRLLKATEDDDHEQTIPAFQRMGYGVKLGYEKENYSVAVTGFYAKDRINSISVVPDEKEVTPKENMVLSVEGSYKIMENLQVRAEYASSGMTQDLRAATLDENRGEPTTLFLRNRASTEYHKAIKAGLDYSFKKSTLGIGYERIDPGYETLGAYFFNNDLENITLNSTTNLFQDKLNLGFSIGYQRDNLQNQRQQGFKRTVGAFNATYNISEVLTLSGSYSNFSTFTNARVNQFDVINDDTPLDDVDDALDYKQLSQNANLNINYLLSKREDLHQNLNINYALADVSNEEGGVVRIGNASTFHNANASYTLGFPQKGMNVTLSLNGTVNTIGTDDSTTWGPILGIANKFFENTMTTNFGISYNTNNSNSLRTNVTNLRANISYVYKKKHNFHINAVQLFKNISSTNTSELNIMFGHSYNF